MESGRSPTASSKELKFKYKYLSVSFNDKLIFFTSNNLIFIYLAYRDKKIY